MGMFSDLHQQDLADQQQQRITKEPTNLATLEPRKVNIQEPTKEGRLEQAPIIPTAPHPQPDTPVAEAPLFDINAKTDRSNTFEFTRAELWAVDDLQKDLERQFDITINKYDVVRCAIHCLVEDYTRQGPASFAVTRLSQKRQR